MRWVKRIAIAVIVLGAVAGVLIYSLHRPGYSASIVGVVRATEVRVEPEINGQLVSIAVKIPASQQRSANSPRSKTLENMRIFSGCLGCIDNSRESGGGAAGIRTHGTGSDVLTLERRIPSPALAQPISGTAGKQKSNHLARN
jgi:hypothetical protein